MSKNLALKSLMFFSSVFAGSTAMAAETTFSCPESRPCSLQCIDIVSEEEVKRLDNIGSAKVIAEGNVVIFDITRKDGEQWIITASNRAVCTLSQG